MTKSQTVNPTTTREGNHDSGIPITQSPLPERPQRPGADGNGRTAPTSPHPLGKTLASRVADGYAIDGVALQEIRDDELVALSCSRNISRFRPGDILCLSRNDPFAHDSVMVNLVEDEETELLISCDGFVDWDSVFAQKTGWTLDIGLLDLSGYILSALAEAGDSDIGRERILPCSWRK